MGRAIRQEVEEAEAGILDGLSDEQRAVVAHDRGPALVCAVAGAGKTTAMTRRIARLVRDVDGERILAVTFTRAGAGAMNDKLERLGVRLRKSRGDGGVRVGTFHSLCLEIIRDGSPWARYEVDEGDKMKFALKDILGFRGMNWKEVDLTEVSGFIGCVKNEAGLDADGEVLPAILAAVVQEHQREGWGDPRYLQALRAYEIERHKRRLLTFDDMLCSAVAHLNSDAGARARWGSRYRHVMVDEFQDTNAAQMALVRHLAVGAESLMVVGDDDQLIYAWRGSRSEYTLGFERTWGAKLYFMQTNFRSRPEVLAPANRVVGLNERRIAKVNVPAREAGGVVDVTSVANSDDEAAGIADQIKSGLAAGKTYRDHAVLYRTNALSRALEEVFIAEKIPHVVIGGTDFYSRKEVADLLAYLRLVVDPNDEDAFARAVNRPFRFVGKETVAKLLDLSRAPGGMLGAARNPPRSLGLQWRQAESIRQFAAVVDELAAMTEKGPGGEKPAGPAALLSRLLDRTDYLSWLARDEGTDTSENSRVSNVKELVRTAMRFASPAPMLEYVDSLKKARKARKQAAEDEPLPDVVVLMTIHKAKGLEWPVVFLAGAAQGILPHSRSTDIEEERRLFYVAVTRAREEIRISCPVCFGIGGGTLKTLAPSQFVGEAGLVLTAAGPSAPAEVAVQGLDGPAGAPAGIGCPVEAIGMRCELLAGHPGPHSLTSGFLDELALPAIAATGRDTARLAKVAPLLVPAQGEMAEESRQNGLDAMADEASVFESSLRTLEAALGPQEGDAGELDVCPYCGGVGCGMCQGAS